MAERTETKTTEKDSEGNKKETTTQTERDRSPANPAAPGSDTAKRGPGSGTNPSGLGGNEESVSG